MKKVLLVCAVTLSFALPAKVSQANARPIVKISPTAVVGLWVSIPANSAIYVYGPTTLRIENTSDKPLYQSFGIEPGYYTFNMYGNSGGAHNYYLTRYPNPTQSVNSASGSATFSGEIGSGGASLSIQ